MLFFFLKFPFVGMDTADATLCYFSYLLFFPAERDQLRFSHYFLSGQPTTSSVYGLINYGSKS